MRKVFSTHADSVDGHLSGRKPDGDPPSQVAPGVTHLHDEVVR
jgi:hypothetical protein